MAFLAAFAIYLFTLCPTVWVGDSGELTAAAHVLGIPHPTGYPLWLLLGKVFTLLVPIGTVSWRLNLFSAVCAALAAELLFRALRRLGCSRAAAYGGALAFALLGPIWGEATVARTYPLAALCSASLWWCSARWLEDRAPRWIVLHQLLLGFGLANHPMVIAHVPALALLVFVRERALFRRPRLLAAAVLALLPGLALYGWLPWRAAADPPIEFRVGVSEGTTTRIGELEEGKALVAYLRREAHQERRWAESIADQLTIVRHHGGEVVREWWWLGLPLLVSGAVAMWRGRRRGLLAAVAVLWTFNLVPLALHGAWWDVFLYSRYLTCGWMALAVVVAFGIESLLAAAWWPATARGAPVRVALALLLPASLFARNFTLCDRRGAWLADDYARALLAEMPQGAQYIGSGDVALYPLLALRYAEGVRPDVTLVSRAQLKGEADLVLARQAARSGAPPPPRVAPLFTADLVAGVQEGLEMERRGLLWQLALPSPAGAVKPPRAALASFVAPPIRGLDRDERDPFARSVIGAIEADLADAAAVRGDREQARTRLQRVAQLRCARPWGVATGIETLLRMAREAQQEARSLPPGELAAPLYTRAREELALAGELARVAREAGDPRDRLTQIQARQIDGWLGMIDAQEFQSSDPTRGVQGLLRAADHLDRVDLAVAAVRAFVRLGLRKEAEEALARFVDRFPASAELAQLARELGLALVKTGAGG